MCKSFLSQSASETLLCQTRFNNAINAKTHIVKCPPYSLCFTAHTTGVQIEARDEGDGGGEGESEVRAVRAPVRDGLRAVCAPQPPRWPIHTIFQELHPVPIHPSILCAFSTGAATAEVSNTFHGNDSNTNDCLYVARRRKNVALYFKRLCWDCTCTDRFLLSFCHKG